MARIAKRTAVRLGVAGLVLLAIFTVSFLMMRLAPGGPFQRLDGMPPETVANLEAKFGLNRPLAVQYFVTLGGYLSGDFGPSLSYAPGVEVAEVLGRTLPVSLELGFFALLLALTLGIAGGALAGARPAGWFDRAATALSLAVISASVIVVGAVARILFIVEGGVFQLGGFDCLANKSLPVLVLGLAYGAIFHRLVRANVAAQAKRGTLTGFEGRGVGRKRAFFKYVLPQALVPMLTYMGTAAAGILTGSFVVESIFEVPGIAACFVHGAQARDYTLVTGAIMVYSVMLLGLNFLTETLHSLLDPRERGRQGGSS